MDSVWLGRCDSLEDCFALGQEGVRGVGWGGELRRLNMFADHSCLLGAFAQFREWRINFIMSVMYERGSHTTDFREI